MSQREDQQQSDRAHRRHFEEKESKRALAHSHPSRSERKLDQNENLHFGKLFFKLSTQNFGAIERIS